MIHEGSSVRPRRNGAADTENALSAENKRAFRLFAGGTTTRTSARTPETVLKIPELQRDELSCSQSDRQCRGRMDSEATSPSAEANVTHHRSALHIPGLRCGSQPGEQVSNRRAFVTRDACVKRCPSARQGWLAWKSDARVRRCGPSIILLTQVLRENAETDVAPEVIVGAAVQVAL